MSKCRRFPARLVTGLRGLSVFWLLFLIPLLDVAAGVLVAPTVIFMSDRQRTGRMTVQNPTDKPTEVTVSFSFGLPVSDSLGNVQVILQDSAVTDPHSALGWLKAFPRKMILPPNGTQIIRFVGRPPKDLPDGEYWARVIVESRAGETEIPVAEDAGAITTHLNMVMRTAIMLKFRKGDLISQLEVNSTEVTFGEEQIQVLVDMSSRGNASYVGLLTCRLLDADNKEICQSTIQLAVYYDLRRKIRLPIIGEGHRKPYQVELSISTKGRTDIAAEDMIPGNEILYTQTVE